MLKLALAAFVLMFTNISLHAQLFQQGTDGTPESENNKTVWVSRCFGGTRAVSGSCRITEPVNGGSNPILKSFGAMVHPTLGSVWVCEWTQPVKAAFLAALCLR